MPLSLEPQAVPLDSISALMTLLQAKGYNAKVILDDSAMERVSRLVTTDERYQLTAQDALQYIEGLLDLPLGFMNELGFIPSDESHICVCGRTPSALDVGHTALSQGIHAKPSIRDTFLGPQHIFGCGTAALFAGSAASHRYSGSKQEQNFVTV
jgi:hypothetical protein